MNGASDEELLAGIAAGPGALPEFYRRQVARVTGMGVRRFDSPEDVADFVANVFLEVLGSADRFDPRRGNAINWLYGVAGNVAAGMYRRQAQTARAERQLAVRTAVVGAMDRTVSDVTHDRAALRLALGARHQRAIGGFRRGGGTVRGGLGATRREQEAET